MRVWMRRLLFPPKPVRILLPPTAAIALLSRFSIDRLYRQMMNGATGTVVWIGVISTAVCMLLRSRRREGTHEQIRE